LAGLDEENEIDRELIAFCYEAVEMCKDPPNGPLDDLAADHPMNDRCEVEFQACIDAHDPGPDASVEEIDDVFLACDEAFMVCIDAPLEDHEDAVPDQADDG